MKRLFFVSIFSFGMLFFVQPQIVSASACTDNRGSCVYNAAGCPSGTSQNNNYACDAGFEGLCCVPTTGDSSDSDSSSGGVDTPCVGDNKVGFSGTCQTFEACGGNPANFDSSEEDCSPGFLCCNGATGAPAGATPQSVCVGKSQNDPCIGPTFNEPGTCRAVPTASSPLSCVVNTGVPSTGGGPSTGSRGGGVITFHGVLKAGGWFSFRDGPFCFSSFSFTLVAKAATCADTANDAGLSFLCKALSNCVRPESPEPNATGCGAGTVCCLGSSRTPVPEIAACGNNGTCVLPNTCGGQILSGNNTCQTNTTSGKTVCCVATAAVNYTCSGQCDDVACATAGKVSCTGTWTPSNFLWLAPLAAL